MILKLSPETIAGGPQAGFAEIPELRVPWVTGFRDLVGRKIPKVSTKLRLADFLGSVRIGVGFNLAYEQTRLALGRIEKALKEAGASLNDVVRTRLFVTDISHWEDFGRAHGEIFKDIKPVTTMVEVKGLIGDELLVEIEATAILPQ